MITKGRNIKPPRIVLYGVEGIGKSDFGASSLNPVFIPTEDGIDELDVASFPKATEYDDVEKYLDFIENNETEHKTLVIDSADWTERLIHQKISKQRNVTNISDIGYQAGYDLAADTWFKLLGRLTDIRDKKNMAIVIIAHAEINKFNSPNTEPYDRYQLKLHKKSAPLVYEWADTVLFANYKVYIQTTDLGFKKEVKRGIGGTERSMYCIEKPAFKAKNRYNLPEELPFEKGQSWNTLINSIKEGRIN